MKAATMVFKVPGPHKSDDGNYDYTIVDECDVDKAAEDGWFKTIKEAVADLEVRAAKAKEEAESAEKKAAAAPVGKKA
jgi:hypothetical protein